MSTRRSFDRLTARLCVLGLVSAAVVDAGEAEPFEEKIAWQLAKEPAQYQSFRASFLAAFNAAEPTALQALLSPDYEGADRFVDFLAMLKKDNGDLKVLRYRALDRRKQRGDGELLAVYHTEFANGSWWETRIGLDSGNRLRRFILTDPNYNEAVPLRRSGTSLQLPFRTGEEWFVLWGGTSEELNYHVRSRAQKNALDLLVVHPSSRQSFKTDGKTNVDYYAFGREILSPAGGVVVETITGVEDNVPGEMNPRQLTGNTIVIRSARGEYILLAHLKQGSIQVAEGDQVEAGQFLGMCGNSGNSSEPHLHLQMMDGPDIGEASGIQMQFAELLLDGGARATNYAPIRGNTVARP